MEKEKVYLDSTIPSYRASELSENAVTLVRQKITIDWWDKNRGNYDLYISEVVLDEIKEGDTEEAKKRLELVGEASLLRNLPETEETAREYMKYFNLPDKLYRDMYHIACSTIYKMDCLLTWNFTHLANFHMRKQLERFNRKLGFETPQIVTPEELLDDKGGEE